MCFAPDRLGGKHQEILENVYIVLYGEIIDCVFAGSPYHSFCITFSLLILLTCK